MHLSEIVFELMGFKDDAQTDEIYRRYLKQAQKVKYLDIASSNDSLGKLAREIYLELSTIKSCAYAKQ